VRQPEIVRTPFAYLRLHGRNAKSWWQHEDRDARYDYLYSMGEVHEFADGLSKAGPGAKARVYFNNHPNAKSVVNAAQLKAVLGQGMPPLGEPLSTLVPVPGRIAVQDRKL
jgi:uncharacterized protein YecE (DUF72 family)